MTHNIDKKQNRLFRLNFRLFRLNFDFSTKFRLSTKFLSFRLIRLIQSTQSTRLDSTRLEDFQRAFDSTRLYQPFSKGLSTRLDSTSQFRLRFRTLAYSVGPTPEVERVIRKLKRKRKLAKNLAILEADESPAIARPTEETKIEEKKEEAADQKMVKYSSVTRKLKNK